MKTENVGQKNDYKTNFTKPMKENNTKEQMDSQDTPMSTQSSESETFERDQLNELCSKHPFNVVNIEGKWIITLGNDMICPHKFESEFDAEEFIRNKPYDLIMVATAIYIERVNKMKKQLKKVKKNGNN